MFWKEERKSDPLLVLFVVMAFILSILLFSAAVVETLASTYPAPDVSISLQDILNKAHQGPLYTYPTSLTQGIVPVSLRQGLLHGSEGGC